MSWTMPHRTLQIVAFLLCLSAAVSFAMGIVSTPQRGARLPGQKGLGAAASAFIDATDATPLSDERIEGAPPPVDEDKAKDEKTDEANVADNADAPTKPPPIVIGNGTPIPALPIPPVGNAAGPEGPAADEPPH